MYKTLKGLGKFVEVLGWIVVVVSGLAFLATLVGAFGNNGNLRPPETIWPWLVLALPWGAGAVAGFLIVCFGELVQCFVDIEENTRETNRLLSGDPKLPQTPQMRSTVAKPNTRDPIPALNATDAQKEEEVRRLLEQMKPRGGGPTT